MIGIVVPSLEEERESRRMVRVASEKARRIMMRGVRIVLVFVFSRLFGCRCSCGQCKGNS
jgi:hypothetical protein